MQKVTYSCDICEKEFNPQEGAGFFTGIVVKVDAELKRHGQQFKTDFCGACVEVVLGFSTEMKKDVTKK